MSWLRHLVLVMVTGLPLLGVALFATARAGAGAMTAAAAAWVLGVLVLASAVWRETVRPLYDLLDELGTRSGHLARWQLRQLHDDLARCREERAATDELMEDLSASLGDGLLVVTQDLKIRLINPMARRFCGWDEVRPGTLLVEVLRDPAVLEVIGTAAQGATPAPAVVRNPRGMWEIHAFPVRMGGAVALLADVGVVQRSAELRRRFVQDLAHELRSPLTVLRTAVESLEDDVPRESAELLVRQVARITRLAAELQELATIEAGELKMQPAELELAELVDEVMGDARPLAVQRGVDLRAAVPEGLVLTSDRRALTRVLSNLVDNAVKYNRAGGWVEVSAEEVAPGFHVVIHDSGVGIPAAELGAVFQRFYRLDQARTPGAGGLGLGLAIVKHLVQRLGGWVTLDSREEVGTRVVLELPHTMPEGERSR